MSTKDIAITTLIDAGDGFGGKALGSLVEQGILRNIQQSTAILLRSSQSGSWSGESTKRWDFGYYPKSLDYNQVSNTKQKVNISTLFAHVNKQRSLAIEVEDFDRQMISANINGVINSFISKGTTVMNADMKYWFYKLSLDFYDKHPENTLFLPELVYEGVLSDTKNKFLQKQIALIPAKMSKAFTNKYMGIPSNEFVGCVDTIGAINFNQLLTGLNASWKSYDAIINGAVAKDTGQLFVAQGLTLLVDAQFNLDIAQGASYNGDYAVDFGTRGFIGEIHHKECKLFPISSPIFKYSVDNNNGNDIYFLKYANGGTIAYGELMRGIFSKLIVFNKKYVNDVDEYLLKKHAANEVTVATGDNHTLQLGTSADTQGRTITWQSSDSTKATVSNTGLVTGIAAGTVNITATITDSEIGTYSDSIEVVVK